jgi:hypothetical protein
MTGVTLKRDSVKREDVPGKGRQQKRPSKSLKSKEACKIVKQRVHLKQ